MATGLIEKIKLIPQGLLIPDDTSVEELTAYAEFAIADQLGVLWRIGDIALAAKKKASELKEPDLEFQVWPVEASPNLIARCRAVSAAYPPEDRNPLATWTIHQNHAKHPNRIALVAAAVAAGQTSDENRQNPATPVSDSPPATKREPEQQPETPPVAAPVDPAELKGWLLAVDVHAFIVARFSVEGHAAAAGFVKWLVELCELLKPKGLTDLVCCFDSKSNFRYEITRGWDNEYKGNREAKDDGLVEQLQLVPTLLKRRNILCVSVDDMESDDVLASYAAQYQGKLTTILSPDKDMCQCLRDGRVNILKNFRKVQRESDGKWVPQLAWVNREAFLAGENSYKASGIVPELWPVFQALAGDSTDHISGCHGVGKTTAEEIIIRYGSAEAIIQAVESGTAELTKLKLQAMKEFLPRFRDTIRLTTLRTDLTVPWTTTLAISNE